MAIAAEAIARAKVEIASRGLTAVVVQNSMAWPSPSAITATRSAASRRREQFVDITQKQEAGGEAAHSDVVKAQLTLEQRQRDVQEAQLAYDKARIGFAVFLFPDFRQDFAVADDLDSLKPLAAFPEIEASRATTIPISAPRRPPSPSRPTASRAPAPGYLPDPLGGLLLRPATPTSTRCTMNSARTTSAAPSWPASTFRCGTGAPRAAGSSRPNSSCSRRSVDLSFTQRQLLSNLNSFYLEASVASSQMASLKHSLDLAEESLRLTLLRYQAGEVTRARSGGRADHALRRAQRLRRRAGALPPGACRPANSNGGLLAHEPRNLSCSSPCSCWPPAPRRRRKRSKRPRPCR